MSSLSMCDPAIVLDNGTGLCKIGYAGEEAPRSCFNAVVGRIKFVLSEEEECAVREAGERRFYVGDDALRHKHGLTLTYPMMHGVVKDWEDMERVWQHGFQSELRTNVIDRYVLLTEAPLDPLANRETMAEIMFEKFQVGGLYVQCPARLCLMSLGKLSGLVVDIGEGVSGVVPIFDGYECPHAVARLDIGGSDVTECLARILTERGYYYNFSSEHRELVREIKESSAYVALDYSSEMCSVPKTACNRHSHRMSVWTGDTVHTLPDGTVLTIGSERFRCAEVLFQPQLIGKEVMPIQDAVYNTVVHCEEDMRRRLLSSIILCGGTTLLPGFAPRLARELKARVADSVSVDIETPVFRKFAVWLGGSIFAEHSSFRSMCVSAAEYDEWGPCLLQDRCPHS